MPFRSSRVRGGFSVGEVPPYGDDEGKLPALSVIIPFSSVEYVGRLSRCLMSIWKQQHIPKEKIEIVLIHISRVAENTQALEELAKAHNARLLSGVRDYKVFPLSLARNAGARAARSDRFVFVDVDIMLDPEALARCVRQPDAFCAIWTLYLRRDVQVGIFDNTARFRWNVRETARKGSKISTTGYGGFLMVPRRLFESVRGYDEVYDQGWGVEDNDLVDRLVRAGKQSGFRLYNVSLEENIVCVHQWHETVAHDRKAGTLLNRERYDTLRTNVRNKDGWGNIQLIEVGQPPPELDSDGNPAASSARKCKAHIVGVMESPQRGPITLSVVVNASSDRYQRRLRRCLNAVCGQVGVQRSAFEIVLSVAQRPKDKQGLGELEGVVAEYKTKTVIARYEDDAFNLSLARNVGAAAAIGDYLCFIDADVILDPETFKRAFAELAPNRYVIVLASYSDKEATDDAYQCGHLARLRKQAQRGRIGVSGFGGCVFVHHCVFQDLGGYDETFVGWGAEDADLCDRLDREGLERVLIEDIPCVHQWHPSRKVAERSFVNPNRQRYEDGKQRSVRRNRTGWGGVASGVTTLMLHHPLRPMACARRALKALEVATNDWRDHVVDFVIQGPTTAPLPDPDAYSFKLNVFQESENIGISVPGLRSIEQFMERGHKWWSKIDDDILFPPCGIEVLIDVIEWERRQGEVNVGAVQLTTGPGTWVHNPRIFVVGRELHKDGRPIFYTDNGYLYDRSKGDVTWRISQCTGWGSTVFDRAVFEAGCLPDTRYFLGCIDTDLCYQMQHEGIWIALVDNPHCVQLVKECYSGKYKGVRYNVDTIRSSGNKFSDKWGVYYKHLAEYKR